MKKKESNNTQDPINNSLRFKKTALVSLIATLLILIAVNVLSSFLFFRWDLTKDKRHSLSDSTVEMLKNLDDKVYVKVYLKGENQPADYQLFSEKVREMLQEFRSYSNNVYFEFINPIEGKSKEESNAIFGEFYKKGLQPIPISKEDESGYSTHYVVPGAMISYKNNECPATLVVADPSGVDWLEYSIQELEYNLVASIRKLLKPKKLKVAFVEGHGELDFINTSWVCWQLQRFYAVDRIRIDGQINALREIAIKDSVSREIEVLGNKYDVLIIAQPTEPFRDKDKYIIDQHIMNGGKVLWLVDQTTASMDSLQNTSECFAFPRDLRLDELFFKYGVRFNANVVQDLSCQTIPVGVGQMGDKTQYKYMAYPYALKVVNFSDHPIVRKMKEIKSDFASTIDFVGPEDRLKKTVLMTTSERTKLVPSPAIVTLMVARSVPNMEEFAFKYKPLAVLVEGVFKSAYDGILPVEFDTIKQFGFKSESVPTRQIFIADGDIIRNFIDKNNQPYPAGYDRYTGTMYDNSEFIMNCINYLCADDDLLQIRSKNLKIGSLNPSKVKSQKNFYAIINIAIPLLLITIMGVVLIILRKMKYGKKKSN